MNLLAAGVLYLRRKDLFGKYTLHEVLDELDVIECFVNPGNAPIQGEVLKKQEDLYTALEVKALLASAKTSEA